MAERKKMGLGKKIGIGIGIAFAVFIVLGIIGAAISSQNSTSENTQTNSENQPNTPEVTSVRGSTDNPAGMNEAVSVDEISYTLVRAQTASSISSFAEADGQFVILTLRATNNGDESETIHGSDFKLIDSKERSFSYDSDSIYLDNAIFLSQLNPGVETTGMIAFDVSLTSDTYTLQISSNKLFGGDEKYISIGKT